MEPTDPLLEALSFKHPDVCGAGHVKNTHTTSVFCTRKKGHDGDHGNFICTWPEEMAVYNDAK